MSRWRKAKKANRRLDLLAEYFGIRNYNHLSRKQYSLALRHINYYLKKQDGKTKTQPAEVTLLQ